MLRITELLAQLLQTKPHPRFDRAERLPEDFRYLTLGHASKIGQFDHVSLLCRQPRKRGIDG